LAVCYVRNADATIPGKVPGGRVAVFHFYIFVVAGSYLVEAFFVGFHQSSLKRLLFFPHKLKPEFFCFYFPMVVRGLSILLGVAWINLFVRLDVLLVLFHQDYVAPISLPIFWSFCLALVAQDLLRYLIHWLAHRWDFLWAFHKVHHRSDRVDLNNVGLFHPFETFYRSGFDLLVVLLFGIQTAALVMTLRKPIVLLQHSKANQDFGFWGYIFASPNHHKIHHINTIHHQWSNLASVFTFWDILFGTFIDPRKHKVEGLEYGVEGESHSNGLLDFLLDPFRHILGKPAGKGVRAESASEP
jgi:sterol desaturase/sphingolipid hydroxylase (fatty acid hydroxylase superfamily)